MLNYRILALIINQFANGHLKVRNYHQGTIYDIDKIKTVDGVYLVWEVNSITPTNIENGGSWVFDVTVFIIDRVHDNTKETDREFVKNECIEIANDLVNYLYFYSTESYTDDLDVKFDTAGGQILPFDDRFDSLYSGCSIDFTITGQRKAGRCYIPAQPATTGDVFIYQNGDNMYTQDSNQLIPNG